MKDSSTIVSIKKLNIFLDELYFDSIASQFSLEMQKKALKT